MARVLFKGVYQEVVVDDYFPCSPKGTLLGAQPAGGKQIWVMVIEKAWAKLHGSYDIIDGTKQYIQVDYPMNLCMPFQELLLTTTWSNSTKIIKMAYSNNYYKPIEKMKLFAVELNPKTFKGSCRKQGLWEVMLILWYNIYYSAWSL